MNLVAFTKRLAAYRVHAFCATVTSKLYFVAPREMLQDEIYLLHQWFVKQAHTARIRAEEELHAKPQWSQP